MSKRNIGNNKFLKQLNQSMILDLIRTNNSISKAELSELTGLSPTAIGVIVSGLLEEGYIHETGIGESKGGRRPILLELKPNSYFSLGFDLDTDYIHAILIDLLGNIVYERFLDMPKDLDAQNVIPALENEIEHVLQSEKLDSEKLLGIGISVPGLVDIKTRKVILAPNLGWNDVDIREHMKRFGDMKIYIENEAMASAICENWLGKCQGVDNFVCINIKSGIGAGIFTNGKLYRGTGGTAGEVGHIVVSENGPKCGCGNYGCLETLASTHSIVENARKLVRQGVVSKLNEIENVDDITIDMIVNAAKGGDEVARSILLESARYLGIAVSNLVNTLNPSAIVLGKDFVKYAEIVLEQVKKVVEGKALKMPTSMIDITYSSIGAKVSALGAAIIPLKTLFGK